MSQSKYFIFVSFFHVPNLDKKFHDTTSNSTGIHLLCPCGYNPPLNFSEQKGTIAAKKVVLQENRLTCTSGSLFVELCSGKK